MKKDIKPQILNVLVLTVMTALVLAPMQARAIPGLGKTFKEGGEYLVKRLLKESAEEGGERLSREAAERLARKYGDDALTMLKKFRTRGIMHVDNYGDDAVKILRRYGDDGSEAMTKYGDDLIRAARRYGVDEATEVVLKHNKLGVQALETFGDDAVAISKKLDKKEMVTVLRYANQIDDPAVTAKLGTLVKTYGGKALKAIGGYMAKNPGKTVLAGAVIYFTNNPEHLEKVIATVAEKIFGFFGRIVGGARKGTVNALGGGPFAKVVGFVVAGIVVLILPATLIFLLRPWLKGLGWLWRPFAKLYRKLRPGCTPKEETTATTPEFKKSDVIEAQESEQA